MKSFTITEAQIQEIVGRAQAISMGGLPLAAVQHVAAIVAVLEAVAAPKIEAPKVPPKKKPKATNGHAAAH